MSKVYRVGRGGAGGLYRVGWGLPWGRGRRGLLRGAWGSTRLLYEEICFTWVVRGTIFLVFMFATRSAAFPGETALSF